MIDLLDSALVRLFDLPAAPKTLRDSEVSFETPAKDYRPALSTVNLFLANVHENLELRSPLPTVEQADGGYTMRPPALRAECRYLMTCWAAGAALTPAAKVAAEHRLFGTALAWLAGFAVLPDAVLEPEFAGQGSPIPLRVARPTSDREDAELWTALGTPPRTYAWISATVEMALTSDGIDLTRADLLELTLNGATAYTVGGQVSTAGTLEPVAGALVTLSPTGRTARSDDAGHFEFADLLEGDYGLDISAPEHHAAQRAVHVPPTAARGFDCELTPLG